MTNDPDKRGAILQGAREYFTSKVMIPHKRNLRDLGLKDFAVNPFLVRYVAGCLSEVIDPEAVARALVYPRTLGTSVSTTFGSAMQGFCRDILGGVFPSGIPGMDIEYEDAIEGRRKYCQVKSGPNTINADDVDTIRHKFRSLGNLARQNGLPLLPGDMVVGVLYGTTADLSGHYRKIDSEIAPVIVGRDFWYHLTGDPDFYDDLVMEISELADEADMADALEEAIDRITAEVAQSAELGFR